MSSEPSLIFLFKSFFKIGITSFGGHAALVSVLQKELVEKKGIISEEVILDGLSIASFLPGPLAVNVVTLIGYKLRGWLGAAISMASVLLPSFILMIAIAALYGKYSNLEPVNNFLSGVIPVIIALILSLCYNMVVKHVSKPWQYITMLLIIVAAFYLNSYQAIILYILTGAVLGYVFSRKDESNQITEPASIDKYKRLYLYSGLVVVVLIFLVLYFVLNGIHHQLLFEFGQVSLTLFGGGYVMIPILHEIVVDNFNWLSSSEFANAIAFGQVTPGPILVSATYVGYKLGGIMGAFLATMGIFVPSAVVMIIVGNVFERVKTYAVMDGIMKGVRPVIIALIAYSGWILFDSLDQKLFSLIITIASFLIITYTKFNYFLVILIAGIIGLLIF
jgi:chromate transporter